MGNVADSKPQRYSDSQTRPTVYGGDAGYMATYRQTNPGGDRIRYGGTNLQFGVKILQDVDPGSKQGELYVVNPAGQRLYISYKGQIAPYASDYLKQAVGYGNGPAVMITGNPLNPQYHVFTEKGGEMHDAGVNWSAVKVNSAADIVRAVSDGGSERTIHGKYANMYGNASINPWGVKAGSDMWTWAGQVGTAEGNIIKTFALPAAEMLLDDVVPLGSTLLQVTGGEKILQEGIDALANEPHFADETSQFDPSLANSIRDPRLDQYLTNVTDRSHQFIQRYGDAGYHDAEKMATDTPQQRLMKARALQKENEQLYAQGQVQELQDTVAKLRTLVGPQEVFQNIDTGLKLATTPQQQMNVISHFSKQLQSDILPMLGSAPVAAQPGGNSGPTQGQAVGGITSSAQVGHPVLSINGTDSRHPGQMTISSSAGVH